MSDAAVRDLTKSMLRLGWAMSMFGADRMREALRGEDPESGAEASRTAFDSMSDAAGERLGERAKKVYEAGDRFQTELVDLFFDTAEPFRSGMEKAFESAADLAERSAEMLRKTGGKEDAEGETATGETAAAEA